MKGENTARILAIAKKDDPDNDSLVQGPLPEGAVFLGILDTDDESSVQKYFGHDNLLLPNVLFVASHPKARAILELVLQWDNNHQRSIQWIHTRSAGIDFISCQLLREWFQHPARDDSLAVRQRMMTNARGLFSSSLAEYTMLSCLYFAKQLPRLQENKQGRVWDPFAMQELKNARMGIIGYGSIGQACARVATQGFSMKVTGLKNRKSKDSIGDEDPYADTIYYGLEGMNRIFEECDFVVCALPLTADTRQCIGHEQFAHAKSNVFINIGRGQVVDEIALVEALQSKKLKGAALDVFAVEPLPHSSPLWEMDNVLISSHNADNIEGTDEAGKPTTFMSESTKFFIQAQVPRFLLGEELLNPVDPETGY